jgi:hypothetical protein
VLTMFLKLEFLRSLGYKEGNLSVRYLSVPLITTKLIFSDCLILVERLKLGLG